MDPSRHGWLRTGEWGIVDEERGTQGYMIRACPSCSGNVVRRRHFERFRALMAVSHIPRRSAEWTFDTFPRDSAKQEAFEDVRRFGRGESLGAWSGMYIHGPLGRGKTGLAICALRARLEQGQPGLFWTTPDLLTDIKATYNREADGPEQAVLNQIGAVDFLVLDDLGTEKPSEWQREKLYQIVNRRCGDSLATIYTSNLTLDRLAAHLGERIAERIRESCFPVELGGLNLRKEVRS